MSKVFGDFSVEFLGIEHSDYFQGFGRAGYDNCVYGIGNTLNEAIDDCLEQMACGSEIVFDDSVEKRIRDDIGDFDGDVTVAEEMGYDDEDEIDEDVEFPYYHVGIRWNEIDN